MHKDVGGAMNGYQCQNPRKVLFSGQVRLAGLKTCLARRLRIVLCWHAIPILDLQTCGRLRDSCRLDNGDSGSLRRSHRIHAGHDFKTVKASAQHDRPGIIVDLRGGGVASGEKCSGVGGKNKVAVDTAMEGFS